MNPSEAAPAEGVISMNHAEATRTLLKYLRDCGREKTAFFALNPQIGGRPDQAGRFRRLEPPFSRGGGTRRLLEPRFSQGVL